MAVVNNTGGYWPIYTSGATTTNTLTAFQFTDSNNRPLWDYGVRFPAPRENELIPETAEAWLRRRVRETCGASGLTQ